jgi:Fur family iron response transcriptional regulator
MLHHTDTAGKTSAEVSELMRACGITPTQQRLDIAQLLLTRPQHLSADQVLAQVNRGGALVSKATVYNTLKLFASKGLIREVIVDPNKLFYDSTTTPHHHIYNVDTGVLTDVSPDQVAITSAVCLPDGTIADGIDVIVRVRNSAAC